MVNLIEQDYNANKKEYDRLEKKLKNMFYGVEIQHVGSTAIPNMKGKNIIDILIGAIDRNQLKKIVESLVKKGYFASTNSKTDNYQFLASKNTETGSGDKHIHVTIKGSDRYYDFVALRDYLLSFPNEAKKYSNYKEIACEKADAERKKYREIKSKYVDNLILRAKNWYKNH